MAQCKHLTLLSLEQRVNTYGGAYSHNIGIVLIFTMAAVFGGAGLGILAREYRIKEIAANPVQEFFKADCLTANAIIQENPSLKLNQSTFFNNVRLNSLNKRFAYMNTYIDFLKYETHHKNDLKGQSSNLSNKFEKVFLALENYKPQEPVPTDLKSFYDFISLDYTGGIPDNDVREDNLKNIREKVPPEPYVVNGGLIGGIIGMLCSTH